MYVLNKEKGRNKLVFLENTDTDQSVCIGKLSYGIMSVLGYDFMADPEKYDAVANTAWENKEISKEIATELSNRTLPSHKPNRITIKPQPVKTKPNGLDVLFGRADY